MRHEFFARRLGELLDWRGMTQTGLARKVRAGRRTVSRWAAGEGMPSSKRLPLLYAALGVTEQQFWDPDWRPHTPSSVERPGPYLGAPTNEVMMALACPRCGARDFSPQARYCRQCAFPLFNYCMHPNMESRHVNPPDATFCEVCARPTFWSQTHVTFEQIRGELALRSARNAEEPADTP